MSSRWFTVFTKDDVAVVERYLYSHTTVALSETVEQYGKTYTAVLCETVADDDDRAEYLAQYQADRLASGLHGTTPPRPSYDEALADLSERSGVTL